MSRIGLFVAGIVVGAAVTTGIADRARGADAGIAATEGDRQLEIV